MSAFGSPWGDIDRTPSDTPYVVDSDGWGWFALFIMLALPFFIIGLLLTQATEWICAHPYISISIYLILSLVIGIILYARGKRWRLPGIIATMITLAPFALVEGLYMVPYIMQNSLFASVFEWLLVTLLIGGITFFVIVISSALKSGLMHLVIAIIFAGIVFLILNNLLSSSDEINWAIVRSLYSKPA